MSLLLSLVFLILALIHFNWTVGNTWGLDQSLPTNNKGERILNPRKIDCAVVGIGLLAFSVFYLNQTSLLNSSFPTWLLKYGGWVLPTIFFVRGIGDFKYSGLFKKVKGTEFAIWDSKLFTPLCFAIALLGFLIKLI